MRRSFVPVFSCLLTLLVLALLAGCGGGDSGGGGVGPPAKIEVNSLSLTRGIIGLDVGQLVVTVRDADDNLIRNQTPTFTSPNTDLADVSPNGLVCAGKWDPDAAPEFSVCIPAATTGTVDISVTAGGLTTTTVVAVHDKIDSIVVGLASAPPACNSGQVAPACVSQGATAPNNTLEFTAVACSNDAAICGGNPTPCPIPANTLGKFSFITSSTAVATVKDSTTDPDNNAVITAVNPGVARISAGQSGTGSIPALFTTCPPASITAHVKDSTSTAFSFAKSETKTLVADLVDTNGVAMKDVAVAWSSSSPIAVSITSAGLATAAAPGSSRIIASCVPPTCNLGSTQGLRSNVVSATVTGTGNPTTVWVTSATAGTNKLYPIDTATDTVGTAIDLPTGFNDPNSMTIDPTGGGLLIGTSDGMLVLDTGARTFAPLPGATGKMLAAGPTMAAVGDPATDEVFLVRYATGGGDIFIITDPVAADFTPDGQKVFIATASGNLVYISSPDVSFRNRPTSGPATDVAVTATGNYAALADPGIDLFEACDDQFLTGLPGGLTPTLIGAAAKPVPAPNNERTQLLAVTASQLFQYDVTDAATGTPCPPAPTISAGTGYSFAGVPAFTPRQLITTSDSARAFVLTDQNRILSYTIGESDSTGATSTIPLAGAATAALTGGVTLDGAKLYVGVEGLNEVQVFNTSTGALIKQIPVPAKPDFVVVQPK